MINPIKLAKFASILFITLSTISITGYLIQQVMDNTKIDLRSYSKDKDKLIDELTDQLLRAYENNASYQETELGTFLESLDLKNKQNSIASLQNEIDFLESRVRDERILTDTISLILIILAISIFGILMYLVNKRNKKKHEWINHLAHQLDNSVSPISLGLKNLKLELSEEDRKETITLLNKDSDKLQALAIKMLKLFKYTQTHKKDIEESKEELNLESIINEIIINLSNNENLILSCISEIETPLIQGDKILIEQLFINLINNAIEFSHPKGEIFIKIFETKSYMKLDVIDRGVGLKSKDKILTDGAVYPAKKTDGNKGHGLGLKLVRRIVRLHNGKFDINNNKDGKGVTATIKLPL